MLSKDYQINLLLNERNFQLNEGDHTKAYYYTRSLVTYIGRLLFAIGWSKIKNNATDDVNREIYTKLFKLLREGKSVEPRKLSAILTINANSINRGGDVQKEVEVLEELGSARNIQSHDEARLDFDKYFESTAKTFQKFEKDYLGKKDCAYIVPLRYEDQRLLCNKYESGCDFYARVSLNRTHVSYTGEFGNRLFYKVVNEEDPTDVNYYCLSPFLEIPEYQGKSRPSFRIYSFMENDGYGSDCVSLHYKDAMPMLEEGTILVFRETSTEYIRKDLFGRQPLPTALIRGQSWVHSRVEKEKVFLNISSYRGYSDDILGNGFLYCSEICSIRKDVLSFCMNKSKQVADITGNGGVGKTALMLSVICELSGERKKYGYSNLIFLSAKKRFYSGGQNPVFQENESDIQDFAELINKLSKLLNVECDPKQDPVTRIQTMATGIVNQISTSSEKKKFLLVIDDFDSMPWYEQEKIREYVYRFDPKNLKTLITSRNYLQSSPISFRIQELTAEQSIAFAEWYVNKKMNGISWKTWKRRDTAEILIRRVGEGNPLRIQQLLTQVNEGSEKIIDFPGTRIDWVAYLYNTVDNLLSKTEKNVFYLCRRLYLALPEELREEYMLLAFPEHLAAGCEIETEDFQKAMDRLVHLKLIAISGNNMQFRPYDTFLLPDEIIHLSIPELSRMYDIFWEDVSVKPMHWLSIGDAERTVTSLILRSENHPSFDNVTSMQILDHILVRVQLPQDLYDTIISWRDRHSVVPAEKGQEIGNELNVRLIQRIEETAETVLRRVDAGGDFDSLAAKLYEDIRVLNAQLAETPSEPIRSRLRRVNAELEDYGF